MFPTYRCEEAECEHLASHRDYHGKWCNSHTKDWDSARALNS